MLEEKKIDIKKRKNLTKLLKAGAVVGGTVALGGIASASPSVFWRDRDGTTTDLNGGTAQTEFSDSEFRVEDNADANKKMAFEVSGVYSGTTRTMTVPDKSGKLVLENTFSLPNAGSYETFNWNTTKLNNDSGTMVADWNAYKLYRQGVDTLDWKTNRLYEAGGGKLVLDWGVKKLHSYHNYYNREVMDWGNQVLKDSGEVTTLNWTQKKLYDGSYQVLNWNNQKMYTNGGGLTQNWAARKLYDTGTVLDWNTQQLQTTGSVKTLNWGNRKTYSSGYNYTSINWSDGKLYESNNYGGSKLSVNWESRGLYQNGSNYKVVDWQYQKLYTGSGSETVDWLNAQLKSNGYTVFDWAYGYFYYSGGRVLELHSSAVVLPFTYGGLYLGNYYLSRLYSDDMGLFIRADGSPYSGGNKLVLGAGQYSGIFFDFGNYTKAYMNNYVLQPQYNEGLGLGSNGYAWNQVWSKQIYNFGTAGNGNFSTIMGGGGLVNGKMYANYGVTASLFNNYSGSMVSGYVRGYSSSSGIVTNADGSHAFGHARDGGYIKTNGQGSFSNGLATNSNGQIYARGDGSFVTGYANGNSLYANGKGAFAAGYLNGGGMDAAYNGSWAGGYSTSSGIYTSSSGSMAFGYANGYYIVSGGVGSLAFGDSSNGAIYAFASNNVQFGPGSNYEANTVAVGTTMRLKGTTGAPSTPRNGDMWVYNNYVYIRSNGVSCKVLNNPL